MDSLNEPQQLLVTIEEAARRLCIGRTQMFKLVQTGAVTSVKVGRSRRVDPTALASFVADLQREPPTNPSTETRRLDGKAVNSAEAALQATNPSTEARRLEGRKTGSAR